MKIRNWILAAIIIVILFAVILIEYAPKNANKPEAINDLAANTTEEIFVQTNNRFADTKVSFNATCVVHDNDFETYFNIVTENYGKDASVGFRFDSPFQGLNENSFILKEKDKRSFTKKVSGIWEYVKTNVYVNVDGEEKRYEKNITCLIGGDTNNGAGTSLLKPADPNPTATVTPDPTTTEPDQTETPLPTVTPDPTEAIPIPEFTPITFLLAMLIVMGMVAITNKKCNKK